MTWCVMCSTFPGNNIRRLDYDGECQMRIMPYREYCLYFYGDMHRYFTNFAIERTSFIVFPMKDGIEGNILIHANISVATMEDYLATIEKIKTNGSIDPFGELDRAVFPDTDVIIQWKSPAPEKEFTLLSFLKMFI